MTLDPNIDRDFYSILAIVFVFGLMFGVVLGVVMGVLL